MYFKEPRDPAPPQLDLLAALTRVAADIILPQWLPPARWRCSGVDRGASTRPGVCATCGRSGC